MKLKKYITDSADGSSVFGLSPGRLRQKGFTFVQILIAIVVMSIAIIPVAGVFFASNRNVEKGGAHLDAMIIMQSVLDNVKNDKFIFENKNKVIDFPNEKYPSLLIEKGFMEKYKAIGRIKIENAEGHNDPDLASVTVTLTWQEDGQAREASIVTYVANLNDIKYTKIE